MPRTLLQGIAAVALLPRNDTLFYVILNEVKNPTEELTVHILLTKVVGYFADAQYDVKIPYRHFVPLPPKEEARFVFASNAKQSPGRVNYHTIYPLSALRATSPEEGSKIRNNI